MNYSKFSTLMKLRIQQYGVPITITRLGASVLKSSAVFDEVKTADDTTSPMASIALVSVSTAIAYIGGSFKNPPQPGDILTGKGRSYKVSAVQTYQPADVVIGYRLELE